MPEIDLVDELRQHETTLMHDAADEIERLKASNAELLAALKGLLHSDLSPVVAKVAPPRAWRAAGAAIEKAEK